VAREVVCMVGSRVAQTVARAAVVHVDSVTVAREVGALAVVVLVVVALETALGLGVGMAVVASAEAGRHS